MWTTRTRPTSSARARVTGPTSRTAQRDNPLVEFSYRLTGTGWSEARIANDKCSTVLTASYLSDALGDLLAAVCDLLDGAGATGCTWQEEPGEYRWSLARHGEYVAVRVQDLVLREGAVVFDALVPLRDFATAIASGAELVLDEHGETGYRERWVEHPFPVEALAAVRDRLD